MDSFTWIIVTVGTVLAGLTIGACDPGDAMLPSPMPEPNAAPVAFAETTPVDGPLRTLPVQGESTRHADVTRAVDYQCSTWCYDRDVGYAWAEERDMLDQEKGLDLLGKNDASRQLLRDSDVERDGD